jgi:hypothetical protein
MGLKAIALNATLKRSVAAAVSNVIFHAMGTRICDFPIAIDKIASGGDLIASYAGTLRVPFPDIRPWSPSGARRSLSLAAITIERIQCPSKMIPRPSQTACRQ